MRHPRKNGRKNDEIGGPRTVFIFSYRTRVAENPIVRRRATQTQVQHGRFILRRFVSASISMSLIATRVVSLLKFCVFSSFSTQQSMT